MTDEQKTWGDLAEDDRQMILDLPYRDDAAVMGLRARTEDGIPLVDALKKIGAALLLMLLCVLPARSQTTTTITGTLRNPGTGTVSTGSFARFWLFGCGGNNPRVNGTAIIAPTLGSQYYFDMVPNSSGAISGTLYSNRDAAGTGNGQVECGGSQTATWYGLQIFQNGKGGPVLPFYAKSAATVDISNVTPITTNPVVTAPTGDSTYARLDAGNTPFTGTVQAPAVTVPAVNTQIYVGNGTYPATAAGINAAIQALPAGATGGTIWLPGGLIPISSTIVIDRSVNLRGQNGNYNDRGTTLQWTGGASVAISISGAAGVSSGTTLQDIALDNTGTGTVGIDIDNNATFVSLNRVYSVPTVGFSVAGLRVGNTTSGSEVFDIYLNETDFENSAINLLLLRCAHFVSVRGRYVNGSTNEIQIGDATHVTDSAHFIGYDIEPNTTTNVTEISILNGSNITFEEGFGEQTGATSIWLDCPSTATNCNNIALRGSWFQANSSPVTIVHSNLATATISIESSEANNFPGASFWVKNDASRRIWLCNLVADSNVSLLTANTNASFCPSNTGSAMTGWWFNDAGFFRNDVTISTLTSTAARLLMVEAATPPAAVASNDILYPDSTAHCLKASYNNGAFNCLAQTVNPVTFDAVYGTYRVTTDQTITAGASLTAIPGLSWTFPANTAINVKFQCDIVYSQATAAASDSFGVQDVTVAPTSAMSKEVAYTSATAFSAANITGLSTTTATAFTSFTPSAAGTNFNATIDGLIEQPSNASTSVFQIMAQFTTNNGTIKRGSSCQVY